MEYQELLKILSSLSNDDLAKLINFASGRIIIFSPDCPSCSPHTLEVDCATINGSAVQINTTKEDYTPEWQIPVEKRGKYRGGLPAGEQEIDPED